MQTINQNGFKFTKKPMTHQQEQFLESFGPEGELVCLLCKICHFGSKLPKTQKRIDWVKQNERRLEYLGQLCGILEMTDSHPHGWVFLGSAYAFCVETPFGLVGFTNKKPISVGEYSGSCPTMFSNAPILAKWIESLGS
jgi:hypothetical protein